MRAQSLNEGLKSLFDKGLNLGSDETKKLIKAHQIPQIDLENLLQNLNHHLKTATEQSAPKKTSSPNASLNAAKIKLKTKTWLENESGEIIFGKGKTELLELIDESGSLLKASKLMGLSYKKAWLHLQQIERMGEDKLVLSKQGRSKDSGSRLSLRAKELLIKYEILQKDIENFANLRFKQLFDENL